MKLLIDTDELVPVGVAVAMVAQVLDREDGLCNFTNGLCIEVKTTKTQKVFKLKKQ
jgi:hypothetical protein